MPPRLQCPDAEFAQVIIDEGIKVVETAGNDPKKWIGLFKQAGLVTIHKCIASRHAVSAVKVGRPLHYTITTITVLYCYYYC
jgi:nitronate monooxygenase